MRTAQQLHRLMSLMSGHHPQRPVANKERVAAIFVFGRAQSEWEVSLGNVGIVQTAASLYHMGLAPKIVLPGYEGNPDGHEGLVETGYPGWKKWKEELIDYRLTTDDILTTEGLGTNTKTEGDDFIDMAKNERWTRAVVVTQPHQMLRAMLGLVKTMEQMRHLMHVLPVCPTSINWIAPVYGSQGEKRMPRYQHADEEWRRIFQYQRQGDLATFEELEGYLLDVLKTQYA